MHAGIPQFEFHAKRSLQVLWSMRTPLGLFGTALDMNRAVWLDNNGGIGASADSFYEYLLKAYILFGETSLHLSPRTPIVALEICTDIALSLPLFLRMSHMRSP